MAGWADLLVICGPTATGKTAAALALAKRLDGEIVSADSMQIYQGLPIGTAQPSEAETEGIPYHLSGFLPPEERFSVADYVRLASRTIEEIRRRNHVPIVAGGTGLYIESLVNGIDFTEVKSDPALRARLQQELQRQGAETLLKGLAQVDPAYAAKLCAADHKRIIRALEWHAQTGETMSERLVRSRPAQKPYHPLMIGLAFPERAQLYARINERVDAMIGQGLLTEARMVYEHQDTYATAAQAIGYKEFFPYWENTQTLAACTAALKQATRRYAKRQLTWFRHMEGIVWLTADDPTLVQKAAALWLGGTAAGEKIEIKDLNRGR